MLIFRTIFCCALLIPSVAFADDANQPADVSYFKDVRPILQANCQGCHQPAKPSGAYLMTSFESLLKAGESGEHIIVPGKPDESYLVAEITPHDGAAEMPEGKPPLTEAEIALIRKWIEQGAKDDSPAATGPKIDQEHPPVYTRPPVITSIAYSPDGKLLAVAGFHEVLLHHADGSGIAARLVGLSERVESVAFSPDGKRLAATGGNPARFGELQIWNLFAESDPATVQPNLTLSVSVAFDTAYGASWSPDGALISVGCLDNVVRAYDSTTGEQKFFNGAHDDWPLDTVFSTDGKFIVSVGRDMATKLYEVATQRFVDNVTSITPGALKGGIAVVAPHPTRNEVLVGGSDGTPRIYRMERVTKRVIGDDANLMRRYPALTGRMFGAAYSPDGKRIACGSNLDGQGELVTFSSEFDFNMPDDIKAIVEKVASSQNADEQKKLEEYITTGVGALTKTPIPGGVYALAYSPDGASIAVAGSSGVIRLVNPADGAIVREFSVVDVATEQPRTSVAANAASTESMSSGDQLPSGTTLTNIAVSPESLDLSGPYAYGQILVTGSLSTGEQIDVTRMAKFAVNNDVAAATPSGRLQALRDGTGVVTLTLGTLTRTIPVNITGVDHPAPLRFIRDVNPVLSRLGCNQGTCHGAKDGKNGFKLSLRGYDPIYDVRAFTDDLKSRRTNVASPDNSLMLLKASGSVPHVGGQLTVPGDAYYETIRRWIAEGAVLDPASPRVASISIEPQNPVVLTTGSKQQMRVIATYDDGTTRDVTGEAYIDSGNTDVAEVNRQAIMTTVRRGEAPILARFEGRYAATTLTSMGDREGFAWNAAVTWGTIDELVAAKWERMKIEPSGLCTDAEFIRRVSLDLTGLPPTSDQVREFLADTRPTRQKRDELVDKLIGSEPFLDHWSNKWADLLQVNSKFLGVEGATTFRNWIREQIAANRPYDQFCLDILTANGSNKTNPPASYYKVLREPDAIMENTTHLFLGVRFNCNKCHDHPFEKWTQDQYYQTAAFFSRVGLKRDPDNADGNIGGTAVEGAKPLWEVVYEKDDGEIKHERTGAVTAPMAPYDRELPVPAEATRREQLAKWITSADNDYFARSYANRIWGYLLGVGLIEPLDDIRAGNPPTNPELLDHLTQYFVQSGFNVRELMRTICKSRTYQLSVATNRWNVDDTQNYSRAVPKRLSAETLFDTIYSVTGAKMQIPGVAEGTRAAALPDAANELKDGFLANLGRPVRESACECERSSGLQLGPVMALMNGPTVSEAISQPDNGIAQLVAAQSDDPSLVNELFLRVLNRPAETYEVDAALKLMTVLRPEHEQLVADLKAYEGQIAPAVAEKAATRDAAVAAAQKAHDDFWATIKDREEAAEKERQDKITAAKQAVTDYEAVLAPKIAEWEQTAATAETAWQLLDLTQLKATTRAKLEKQDDLSVFASGANNRKGNYTANAKVDLEGITGIKLELFADDRLPSRGPGRSGGGNFVLSEFIVEVNPKGREEKNIPVKLQNAKADYSQDGYSVATAIDGQAPSEGNGWATYPKVGENRVATFELVEKLTLKAGETLMFTLDQQYADNMHTIGRFRLSVTNSPVISDGLPMNILDIVKLQPDQRSGEQKIALVEFFKSKDNELQKLRGVLAEAEKARPEDPQLVSLREALVEAQKPVPEDPQFARMKRAVQLSEEQLKNERLTAAQDLAWALINSPAFLFNR